MTDIIYFDEFRLKDVSDLIDYGEKLGLNLESYNKRQEMVFVIINKYIEQKKTIIAKGVLDLSNENNFGFLRFIESNYMQSSLDIYVSPNQIRKLRLRMGDEIESEIRAPKDNERYVSVSKIIKVNGVDVSKIHKHRKTFDKLTPVYPDEKINLEIDTNGKPIDIMDPTSGFTSKVIDLICPIGKGQRALIVAPPKVGKTMMLVDIANAIVRNHKEVHVIILLVDERPEEVTDISRRVKADVVSSNFDESAESHTKTSDMVIERAKRMVEHKKDVVVLLDSMTRLARAYNNITSPSGRVLTGGVDAKGLEKPKKFFGAARNIEEGGSLTIIATTLVDTGSKMDEVIFEEFKGTGNSEIVMDRKIAEKGLFPGIDISKSGTRREDLLVDKATLSKMWILRKILVQMGSSEAIEFLRDKLKNTKNNQELFDSMNS